MSDMTTPRPDPTALTTQQLWREVSALKELLTSRIDAIEKAIIVAHDDHVRVPTEIQKQVGNLRELHDDKFKCMQVLIDEKFGNVYGRFDERDKTAMEFRKAIDEKFQATKELGSEHNNFTSTALAKSEASIAKQIEQQGVLIATGFKTQDDKIDAVKDRVLRIEGMDSGTDKASAVRNISNSFTVMVVGIAISAVLGATAIVISLLR